LFVVAPGGAVRQPPHWLASGYLGACALHGLLMTLDDVSDIMLASGRDQL